MFLLLLTYFVFVFDFVIILFLFYRCMSNKYFQREGHTTTMSVSAFHHYPHPLPWLPELEPSRHVIAASVWRARRCRHAGASTSSWDGSPRQNDRSTTASVIRVVVYCRLFSFHGCLCKPAL